MKLKFITFINTIILCLVFNNIQGQTNQLPLKDSAIGLLQHLSKFSNYKIHFIEIVHPLSPQKDYIDTTKISYFYNPLNKANYFFVLQYNNLMGVVNKDSCHLYFESDKKYSRYYVHCSPCKDVVQQKFYRPLNPSEWIYHLNKDSIINISLQHKGDTIKLTLSGFCYPNNFNKYQVDYYFNAHDGFPVKYFHRIEFNGDFETDECQIIDYSLKPDLQLEDFLNRLMLIPEPAIILEEISSY